MKISTLVRTERKRMKLSQLELAEYAGCGLTFVNQLERGKETLQLNKVLNVLAVLGIEMHLRRGKEKISVDSRLESR